MGLDGPASQVFPKRWSAHHRQALTSAMTAVCTITRAATKGTSGTNGLYSPPPRTTVYAGPCRVGTPPSSTEDLRIHGEQQQTQRSYQVAIRHDTAQIVIGDQVEITQTNDPGLIGMKLRVADVRYGSEHWQRDLTAVEIEVGK